MTNEQTKEMEIEKAEDALLTPIGEIGLPESKILEDVEWCFQFFNNEPVVFGYQNEGTEPLPLTLQIQPKENESLNFKQNGMEFKIFPRPISELTKLERENESKNKEA